MNDCKKFNETALPEKEEFYSNMNMEDITDADYMHGKEFVKPYHDLYLIHYLWMMFLKTLENCFLKFII